MVRWLGLLGLGVLLAGPASAADPAWTVTCGGQGEARRCSAFAVQDFTNNRGGRGEVSITIVRDPTCTTLHVTFDGPIAMNRPARLLVDGAPPQAFYTADQLERLARALDDGNRPERAPPEFDHFLTQVSLGELKGAEPGDEMVSRFAALKEPRRLGLACAPTERLLPYLAAARTLTVEFSAEPRNRARVYHWVSLTDRSIAVRLDGLAAALDRIAAGQ